MNLNAAITIRYGGTYSATFTSGHISQKVKLQIIPSGYTPVAVLGLNFASTFLRWWVTAQWSMMALIFTFQLDIFLSLTIMVLLIFLLLLCM